ncbi:MAG: sulfurtransferase TusA family protein [Cyanobium sp.]
MSGAAPPPLDLRGTPCPLNYIRTRLALEKLPPGESLEVWLDRGEPERMVSEGLQGEGRRVERADLDGTAVRLTVHPSAATAPAAASAPATDETPATGETPAAGENPATGEATACPPPAGATPSDG